MTIIDCLEKGANILFACMPRNRPSKADIDAVCVIAHRGAHDKHLKIIENTHEAFERAREFGCWGIELDVHTTLDQVLVVNHDPTLHRIWNKDSAISKLTFRELREQAPLIPSLAEVVERYGKHLHLFIELKDPFHAEETLAATLESLTPEEDYHLLSLDEPIFAALTRFPRAAMLLVAVHNNVAKFCRLSLQKNYGGVFGHYSLLSKAQMRRLVAANQKTGVGFIGSKNSLYRELNRGHEWLFTDSVSKINSFLTQLKATEQPR